MPERYAEVIVDVAAAEIDRVFHYRIPPNLQHVQVGSLVLVPFGRRRIPGFVVGFTDRTDVPPERLRELIAELDDQPVLAPDAIPLCHWMVERYLCRFVQALRVMLPPAARRPAPRRARALVVEATVPATELSAARQQLAPRAPRQAEALDRLLVALASGRATVPLAELTRGARLRPAVFRALEARGLVRLRWLEPDGAPGPGPRPTPDVPEASLHEPNAEQARALARIESHLRSGRHAAMLLWGVTGSGKTEVYLHAIRQALALGRGSIVLVPEISLTPQVIERFERALGAGVAVLHSNLSAGERYDQWRRIRRGEARVVVGARSAVFAPVTQLGLIVVDEEHAESYKQEEAPRYHAREVALQRGRLNDALVLLGSATPSLDTVYRVHTGHLEQLRLRRRIAGRCQPAVTIVDMRAEHRRGRRGFFSVALLEAMNRSLERGQQVLLFLNRRGYATVVLCRECGAAVRCPRCAVSLTFHRAALRLRCHYCGYQRRPPERCPRCGGSAIGYFGAGTQRVEQAARQLFPGARVARMDGDTTRRRGSHERIYRAFRNGEIDILVGTQMVARGWDVPGVTTVGVIDADTALHLPDFRSAERTFELLVQVAGRAGRGGDPGTVIVQTYNPEHYAVRAAASDDPDSFYAAELAARRPLGYPPFGELIRMLAYGPNEREVAAAAAGLAEALREAVNRHGVAAEILGPSPAPLVQLRGMYRWHLLLKGGEGAQLRQLVRRSLSAPGTLGSSVRIAVDPQPYNLL